MNVTDRFSTDPVVKLKSYMVEDMTRALANPENLLEDGSVNWNFVDADTYMDTIARYPLDQREFVEKTFYTLFDNVADEVVA